MSVLQLALRKEIRQPVTSKYDFALSRNSYRPVRVWRKHNKITREVEGMYETIV
jgi:hypothetical protein